MPECQSWAFRDYIEMQDLDDIVHVLVPCGSHRIVSE